MAKTKVKAYKGWHRLELDDKVIENQYEYSKKSPIILAAMSNFADSGCWSVEDFRLTKSKTPNEYFEGNDACIYEVTSEEDKLKLIARLHTYREVESNGKKYVVWNTFDKVLLDGDNPSCVDKSGHTQNIIARFSYQKALEKFNEIKEYWDKFEGTDLMQCKIHNPNLQISQSEFFAEVNAK